MLEEMEAQVVNANFMLEFPTRGEDPNDEDVSPLSPCFPLDSGAPFDSDSGQPVQSFSAAVGEREGISVDESSAYASFCSGTYNMSFSIMDMTNNDERKQVCNKQCNTCRMLSSCSVRIKPCFRFCAFSTKLADTRGMEHKCHYVAWEARTEQTSQFEHLFGSCPWDPPPSFLQQLAISN